MSDFNNSISEFLDDMKEHLNAPSVDAVEEAVSEGVKNLRSKISKVEITEEEKKKEEPKAPEAKKVGTELADKAIQTYKTRINPDNDKPVGAVEAPSTIASRADIKAIARSLAGMRTDAGDVGQGSCTTENGNGNVSNPDSSYAANVSSLSLEDYKAHIFGSFGLLEEGKKDDSYLETDFKKRQKNNEKARKEMEKVPGQKNPHFEEVDIIATFEEALLGLSERDWISVDKVTRQIAEDHGVVVKELNREFKQVHGQYPDKWIKEQVEVEVCGHMPLDEVVRYNKVGMVYDVTFMFRGKTQRFKFFWPHVGRPDREEMQKAVELFYPKARLIAYYPSQDNQDNHMVIVPPMSEHYVAYESDCWEELSEEANEILHTIAEEVGEPVSSVERLEEGYSVIVADHDTGEEVAVTFQEDWQKVNKSDKTDGMSQKAVNAYKRENPGSKLKTAVTEKNPTGKRAGRRKSFCSRSNGQRKMHNIDCSKTPDKAICKARRRWNC